MKKLISYMIVLFTALLFITNVSAVDCSKLSLYECENSTECRIDYDTQKGCVNASTDKKFCGDVDHGGISGIPAKVPELLSFIIVMIQVATAVILVIMGSLDLFKGITSGKEEEIKKGQQVFIKRLILGALVFFVVLIVRLLIGIVAKSSSANIISCMDCFINNKCNNYVSDKENEENQDAFRSREYTSKTDEQKKSTISTIDNASKKGTSSSDSNKEKDSSNSSSSNSSNNQTTLTQFQKLLKKANISESTLNQKNISQLIIVNSSGTSADISYYYKNSSNWQIDESLSCNGYVGSKGTTSDPAEGKSATPKGLYAVGDAFYQGSKPTTKLSTFKITNNTYWIDDVNSSLYNQKFVGNLESGISSEKMWTISVYKYGFVIRYNMDPIVKGKGSAIFFHISSGGPTSGCVSAPESSVLKYLSKLDKSKNPYILII